MKRYQDITLSAKERAKALLAEMTLNEKVGQLNQRLYGFAIYERKQTPDGEVVELSDDFKEEVEKYSGLGCLYGLYRADPWAAKDYSTGLTGVTAKKVYNQVQRYVIEHSRLGIPMMMSSECPHGHQALDGYLLPVNLCIGATFDPELLKEAYKVCGKQLQEMGVDLALVSMLDVLRDPRWGRSEECFSEDPLLCAKMAEAAVEAIQQTGPYVVAKHFAAQGEGTGGVNASAARIGERELREIHLPPMAACAKAGAKGVMAAYNEIDGIYCHANRWLLTDVLRGEMGFDGIVMSDGVALNQLDFMTGDNVKSGAAGLTAGVDMGLWDTAFGHLEEAVARGYVTEEQVDAAALRILTMKFERGLFDHPYLPEEEGESFDGKTYPQSLQIARESAVLLHNNSGVLPFDKKEKKKILVTGPNADALYHQLGDYTPPMREGEGSTVLAGMKQVFGAENISFAQGALLREENEALLNQAKTQMENCDAVVCVLGTSSSRFSGAVFDSNGAAITGAAAMDCGEGMDCAVLELPRSQLLLLEAAKASGKPVVTVVIAGRPPVLTDVCALSDGVLLAFYPGPYGGQAIAEILAGDVNPSGRLPVSLPRTTGQVPVYYNFKSSYRAMHYMDQEEGPLYSFGHGLDYSEYEWSEIGLSHEKITMEQLEYNGVYLKALVKNTGKFDGTVVPQLYVTDVSADVVRRTKELKDFARVEVEAGEEAAVLLYLTKKDLSYWKQNMTFDTDPGIFIIELADQGKCIWKGELELCI
ncbi:MAG: glycoside hydrolase family 3 C-terminal domain-containing protein [Lachnospiraceae bacterium]|nr:glycoside hydrolase family 3 C-terminal domain-containing protein [Lachnospiraceae bacterium]